MGIFLKQTFKDKTEKAERTRGQLIYYFKKLHYSALLVSKRRELTDLITSTLYCLV
jgi:hypothetical protein